MVEKMRKSDISAFILKAMKAPELKEKLEESEKLIKRTSSDLGREAQENRRNCTGSLISGPKILWFLLLLLLLLFFLKYSWHRVLCHTANWLSYTHIDILFRDIFSIMAYHTGYWASFLCYSDSASFAIFSVKLPVILKSLKDVTSGPLSKTQCSQCRDSLVPGQG